MSRNVHLVERGLARRLIKHLILFLATLVTTTMVGGPWYALALMTILLLHETGHYLMCRRYHVRATFPFFIPFPLGPLGTMGAVIVMRSPIRSKRALFDIGMAGPLLGFLAIVPITVAGIMLSTTVPLPDDAADPLSVVSDPLCFIVLTFLLGVKVPEGQTLLLHPLAYAGWVGTLVTGLNLLPVGQLDGGHVLYAILGRKAKPVFWIVLCGLMGVTVFWWAGWFLFVVLLLLFIRRHPPVRDEAEDLGKRRYVLAGLMLAIFVLSFNPAPFPAMGSIVSLVPDFAELFKTMVMHVVQWMLGLSS